MTRARRGNGDGAPLFSDEALALNFAERHANDLRFVAKFGQWLRWDGQRWCLDDTLNTFDLARAMCREEAARCNKKHESKALASAKTVAAVERLAKADRRIAAKSAQWDAQPWKFNIGGFNNGGTIELHTGTENSPERTDYLTQMAACAIAPSGTPHSLWSKFLNRITDNNIELIGFLRRYTGYCLTGVTTEHVFVFAYGTGANGKGTFINTIEKIFGDYATVADMNTLVASKTERHPTDLAKLRGARLVVAQETQEGRQWDEAKIKTLTGGDIQTARFMRQDFFDFEPTFKLFIVGNHKPRLGNVDEAMRRRLLLVPFIVQIPEVERDPHLQRKLKAEWPAILRWAIDGCIEWQRIGLAPPAIVRDATAEYFAGEDLFGQWIEDDCDAEIGNEWKWEPVGALFDGWSAFALGAKEKPGTKKAFSEQMQARGFVRRTKGHAKIRGFAGIRLKPKNTNDYNDN
jgi:putative DNA primase/helicase